MGRIRWAETNSRNFSQSGQRPKPEARRRLTGIDISEEKCDKIEQKVEMRTWAAIIIAALWAVRCANPGQIALSTCLSTLECRF